MGHTYSPGGSAKDDVRLLVGDTDDNANVNLRLEDAEIEQLLILQTGTLTPGTTGKLRAAADAADALAAKFARAFEGSSSGPGPSRTRAQELRSTANALRARAAAGAVPFAGGISRTEKAAAAADTDRLKPPFRVGMLDHPESDAPDTDTP